MDTVLARILDLLSEKGITDKTFCLDNSFSLSTVSDWKSGRNQSYKKHIQKIAQYLHVSTDYLLGNEQKNIPADDDLDEDDAPEEIVILSRAAQKMTPENRKKLLDMAKLMFKEDFED